MLRHVLQLLRALGWWVGGLIPHGVKLSEVGQYRPSPLLPASVSPILTAPHPQFPCTPRAGGCCMLYWCTFGTRLLMYQPQLLHSPWRSAPPDLQHAVLGAVPPLPGPGHPGDPVPGAESCCAS